MLSRRAQERSQASQGEGAPALATPIVFSRTLGHPAKSGGMLTASAVMWNLPRERVESVIRRIKINLETTNQWVWAITSWMGCCYCCCCYDYRRGDGRGMSGWWGELQAQRPSREVAHQRAMMREDSRALSFLTSVMAVAAATAAATRKAIETALPFPQSPWPPKSTGGCATSTKPIMLARTPDICTQLSCSPRNTKDKTAHTVHARHQRKGTGRDCE